MSLVATEGTRAQHVVPLAAWDGMLGSRALGAKVRQQVLAELQAEGQLVLDWDGVRAISHSFADEFIGKLAEEIGVEQFRSTVRNRNMSSLIRSVLSYVVSARLGPMTQRG